MSESNVLDVNLVIQAMQGDEAAFREIYNITYNNKLFIAKKYMKNDTAAEDVLQDAYIKIWVNLPSLDKPENFSAWSSKIVANTALNELRKNQPMFFSEMSNEQDDGSELFYEVEDTYVPNQPELNYTEQEEQNIVREMIDSLSDDQRMCIMMYYIEGLGVREIAESLGCSEGTVKSRLNYGRKNIKVKAEELQKKGYDFKGISALALLLLLLRKQAAKAGATPVAVSAGTMPLAGNISGGYGAVPQATAGTSSAEASAAGGAAKSAVKGAFAKTAAGKAIIALVVTAFIVATAAVVMLVKYNDDGDDSHDLPDITSTEELVDTMATPDIADTEAVTDEVVEEPEEDLSYISEYERILQENSEAIQRYETNSGLYHEPEKVVAIIDTFGDSVPELFFLTCDVPSTSVIGDGTLHVYTMKEGKAVSVLSETYDVSAGSGQRNTIYASKSKQAFYWDYIPSHGTGEMEFITKKTGYDIVSDQTEELKISYNHIWDEEGTGINERYDYFVSGTSTDEASYQTVKEEWKADYGDIILYNWDQNSADGNVTETFDYQYSYTDAINKLEELKSSLGMDAADMQTTGEMTNEKAHAMGDEFLSDFYDVTRVDNMSDEGRLAYEAFAEKYHIHMMMPTGTGVSYLDTDSYEYAYFDINNDGIDELIIEYGAIISFRNGTPVALDAQTGATNVSISVLENGHILISSQGTGWAPQFTEHEVAEDGISLLFVDGVKIDGTSGKYYVVGSNGENIQEISEEEYNMIVSGKVQRQISFIPLSTVK